MGRPFRVGSDPRIFTSDKEASDALGKSERMIRYYKENGKAFFLESGDSDLGSNLVTGEDKETSHAAVSDAGLNAPEIPGRDAWENQPDTPPLPQGPAITPVDSGRLSFAARPQEQTAHHRAVPPMLDVGRSEILFLPSAAASRPPETLWPAFPWQRILALAVGILLIMALALGWIG
jgi:hypothetical protein